MTNITSEEEGEGSEILCVGGNKSLLKYLSNIFQNIEMLFDKYHV